MKMTFEQLTEATKKIALNPEEKNILDDALLRHMEECPVNVSSPYLVRHYPGGKQAVTNQKNKLIMIISLIVAVLLSGSVSYAAEASLPGDTLYPIKTEVNERVRGAFAISDESEANLQAKLAVTRLDEAAKLAEDNRLSDEAIVELEGSFENHANRSKDYVTRLEADSKFEAAAKVNSDFEAALDAHETILNRLYSEVGASSTSKIGELVIKVKTVSESRHEDNQKLEIKLRGGISGDELKASPSSSTIIGTEIKINTDDDGRVEIKSETSQDDKVDGEIDVNVNTSIYSDDNGATLGGSATAGVKVGL